MKDERRGVAGSIPPAGAPLQPEQIVLIRASFAILAPMADDVTTLFYRRLFELDPALRALFPRDMATQGRKFMTMLAIMARGLEALDRLLPDVRNLGRRHVDYGVQDAPGGAWPGRAAR